MDPRASELIRYIQTTLVRRPSLELREDTPLLSSGLVDSFAFVDLLEQLQVVTGKQLDAGRAGPEDFETVQRMLELADRA